MADSGSFNIGFEIEAMFVSKYKYKAKGKDDKGVESYAQKIERAEDLAMKLASNHHNIRKREESIIADMRVIENFASSGQLGQKYDKTDYEMWEIKLDQTLSTKSETECPLEVTSPVMVFDSNGAWREQVIKTFNLFFNEVEEIKTDNSCAFQVHISPVGRSWSLAELKSISLAILHFEQAFLALMPKSRWGNNEQIKLNSGNKMLKDLSREER